MFTTESYVLSLNQSDYRIFRCFFFFSYSFFIYLHFFPVHFVHLAQKKRHSNLFFLFLTCIQSFFSFLVRCCSSRICKLPISLDRVEPISLKLLLVFLLCRPFETKLKFNCKCRSASGVYIKGVAGCFYFFTAWNTK